MVSKTREKLIEVARQLFIKKGVENTTMNDIATASDRGRRTIYTYFKNKREIYRAVLESQSEQSVHELRLINDLDCSPAEKLKQYLRKRFRIMDHFGSRADRLRYFFSREQRRKEHIMKLTSEKEREILSSILRQGVECGEFNLEQARRFIRIEHIITSGVCLETTESSRDDIISFIVDAILTTNNPNNNLTQQNS